ncbi:MAG: inorganic phosphate transporter [Clostridiales Family XIII bacterium]|jgi:PiT family inorganic phosphate transporter|nr:inorganic phosphate transporter [Clostridiales Family XIII bacterium]
MTISLEYFLSQLSNPVFFVTTVLTLGVILVNGWTDAPNAIATCVSTRSMDVRKAIWMAAVFNFLGVLVMTALNATVAHTIYRMVDFGGDSRVALSALCAAMLSIVLWATAAWRFGIPTSESHALIAGISGAAMALQGGLSGINASEWIKVLYGLVLSTALGFFMGYLAVKGIEFLFYGVDRVRAQGMFMRAQVAAAAGMAFMHGAQDGQKFMGVFLLGLFLSAGRADVDLFVIPVWLMVLCSLIMALGTSIGGYRIIKSVGMDMVKLEKHQGFAADLAAVFCLLLASIWGLPVSTTHTKTTAIMGVGAARRLSCVNWKIVGEMILTWVLTFPGCGLIGYLMARLFIAVF